MAEEMSYLVAVSVPDDYMCTGRHNSALLQTSTTTTTTTTTTTSTNTTITTTTAATTPTITATTTSEACETNGICVKTDGRDITWEAEFGSEAVNDCPESEGIILSCLLYIKYLFSSGKARWYCSGCTGDFVGEEPDRSGCIAPWVDNLADRVASITFLHPSLTIP